MICEHGNDAAHPTRCPACSRAGVLDPGVRRFVAVLRAAGVETFESCDAGEGHAAPEPMVRFHGGAGAGLHALGVAIEHRLPVAELRRVWVVEGAEPTGPWWTMTFSRTG